MDRLVELQVAVISAGRPVVVDNRGTLFDVDEDHVPLLPSGVDGDAEEARQRPCFGEYFRARVFGANGTQCLQAESIQFEPDGTIKTRLIELTNDNPVLQHLLVAAKQVTAITSQTA